MPDSEVDSDFGHLNNEMWLLMSDGQYVEEGLSEQCTTGPATGPHQTCSTNGGTDSYLQFWGDADSSGKAYFHLIDTSSADGNSHEYEVWDGSNCANDNYSVYLDYNLVGTSTVQTSCQGDHINAGLELYSPPGINSNEYTGGTWFHSYVEVYKNSVGSWAYADFDSGTYHSLPCGDDDNCAMDDCSAFADGSCLHWGLASDYEWSDNKPS